MPLVAAETSAEKQQSLFGFIKLKELDNYNLEYSCMGISLLIIGFMIYGRKKNEDLAVSMTTELLQPGTVIDRNFAEVDRDVIKEGPAHYKTYVSGRRFCKGMIISFRLARRQDILAIFVGSATNDIIDIEVAMNESSMPSTTLFIASPAANKVIPEDNQDIASFTKKLEPPRDRIAHWPSDQLIVKAEHSSVFYDSMNPHIMDLCFNSTTSFQKIKKYFRFIHATSEYHHSEQKHMLRVSFALPSSATDRKDIAQRFLTLTMHLIDVLGTTKLTPEQSKRAQEARQIADKKRKNASEEMEKRLEERRAQKEADEKARLAKLPRDVREKERAKKEKLLRERKLRSMMRK